jgi:AAA domain
MEYVEPESGSLCVTQTPFALSIAGERSESGPLEFRPLSHLRELPPEPPWLWEGFLVPGSLTMLAGHPFAGKSTLVGGLLRSLELGEPFLGRVTRQGTALLLSEEDDYGLRSRGGVLGLLDSKSEYVGRGSGVLSLEWPQLIELSTSHALSQGHSLLVIDTFPGLAGLGDEQENDAGAIGERMRPLQRAAAEGLAVLFLHHMNGFGKPRGSKAFRGIVDIELLLGRGSTNTNTVNLNSVTRYASPLPPKLRAELVQTAGGWYYRVLEGSSTPSPRQSGATTDDRLWEAIRKAEGPGITYAEIDRIEGLSQHMAKKRFPGWHADGRLGRTGKGSKADPFRWFIPTS